jgi:hypothetical protein
VPFSTDRHVRNWMMGYYLNNARFRLAAAREKLGVVRVDEPGTIETLVPVGLGAGAGLSPLQAAKRLRARCEIN